MCLPPSKKWVLNMEKFLLDLLAGLVSVGIAVAVVYAMGWLTGQDVNDIVGWAALGMAATSNRG